MEERRVLGEKRGWVFVGKENGRYEEEGVLGERIENVVQRGARNG